MWFKGVDFGPLADDLVQKLKIALIEKPPGTRSNYNKPLHHYNKTITFMEYIIQEVNTF